MKNKTEVMIVDGYYSIKRLALSLLVLECAFAVEPQPIVPKTEIKYGPQKNTKKGKRKSW